jgi:thioredoxin-like negative regulator of GroEL
VQAALAHKYKGNPDVHVAKMDCTESETVCGLQGVKGYPSLMLYKNGVLSATHTGGRTLGDLDEFLRIHAEEAISDGDDGHDEL